MILRLPTARRNASALLALGAALALAACGGDEGERDSAGATATGAQPPPVTTPSRVAPADVRVVRDWADTLRHGDIAGAAARFAVPTIVANGTDPLRLTSRAAIRGFNRSLPCGARLIGTAPAPHGFLVATFRLTERPGVGECGTGTGGTARTAIRVRHGLIVYWLRLDDSRRDPAPQVEGTPS